MQPMTPAAVVTEDFPVKLAGGLGVRCVGCGGGEVKRREVGWCRARDILGGHGEEGKVSYAMHYGTRGNLRRREGRTDSEEHEHDDQ